MDNDAGLGIRDSIDASSRQVGQVDQVSAPVLLRVDAARALAAFYAAGGVLCAVTVLLARSPSLQTARVSAVSVAALLIAALLALGGGVADRFCGALVAVGSVLIGVLVDAGSNTQTALAFAGYAVWVAVYAALFFSTRRAVAHFAIVAGSVLAGWAGSQQQWLDPVLVLLAGATTGVVVADMVRRVRAGYERDDLTGLLTHYALMTRATPVLRDAATNNEPVAVLMLQIQGLSRVAQSLGHASVDLLLHRIGATLAPLGADNGTLGARLSGDRLVAVLPPGRLADCRARCTSADGRTASDSDGAVWAAHETLRVIRGPHRLAGVDVHLEGHLGVVMAADVDGGLPALLRAAEATVTEAVHSDVPVVLFDPSVDVSTADQLQLLAELREAIPAGQLRVLYQVQVGAHTGRPLAVEALVRWQHPRLGLLAPATFLPMAETTDVIVELTWQVLDQTLAQCAAWRAAGRHVPVSVNLSARLLTHPHLLDTVTSHLHRHRVPATMLTLEVTETALVANPEQARAILASLRHAGVRTSLDDFGTGQSSLSLLARMDFDELKIDRGFVTGLLTDPRAAAIVRSVLHLGRGLGHSVVAEGVEDAETAQWLAQLGCDVLQGYHYGRPSPAGDLIDLPHSAPTPRVDPARYLGHAPQLPAQREHDRLIALRELDVLDTAPDTHLDALAALAGQLCATPIALVSLVDADRQWFKAAIGCDLTQTPRSQAFCAHALTRDDVLEVPDARADYRFSDNPLVTGDPHIRFYAGAPLKTPAGHVIGTLCVLDTQPRTLSHDQRTGLRTIAAAVTAHLNRNAHR